MRVEFVTGEADFASMTFHHHAPVPHITIDFDNNQDHDWSRWEGTWSLAEGQYLHWRLLSAKTTYGNENWHLYRGSGYYDGPGHRGCWIFVRARNPANGMELGQNNGDFIQAYYAYIRTDGVYLGKQNFNWHYITGANINLALDTWYTMKVVVSGSNIKVYLDDMNQPKIDYTDHSAQVFTAWQSGTSHSIKNLFYFDNFKVYP